MNQEKKHEIALMRYSAIASLVSGLQENDDSLDAYYRTVSQKGVICRDGSIRHFSPSTIERWYRLYKEGGFDALLPESRSDEGESRKLDIDLQNHVKEIKENHPHMSIAAIYRQLEDDGSILKGELSESTLGRFINQLNIEQKTTTNQDLRRYERPHVNEVWCGDTSVGPYLKTSDRQKHKVFIIALIDDASRFITGIDVFLNDNFVNLMSVMKSAVAKFGRPKLFNFDNGKSFSNKQMMLLAARIGSSIHYDQPYTPIQKAKIERWFRTMKSQWMASLDMKKIHSLDELRASLQAYTHAYNRTPHSSLKGKCPRDRYLSEPDCFRRLSDEDIDKFFLLEMPRQVSADCVFVFDKTEYEVDCRFAKQRVSIRYSPDMKEVFIVEADGTLTPVRLLNKAENAQVKRNKVYLYGGDES